MFIQTEVTPNPATLKFLPGVEISASGPVNLTDKTQSSISPLAEALFSIEHVNAVFLGSDFITITKSEEGEWDLMKPDILLTIMEYISAGKPVLLSESNADITVSYSEEDAEIVKQIMELIEVRVRPAVAMDGGDIIFRSFENGVVKLELHGSCSGCPSSTITLKNGIENMLKHYVPEVVAVEAV